jgi:hypothetical protein
MSSVRITLGTKYAMQLGVQVVVATPFTSVIAKPLVAGGDGWQ